MLSVEEVMGTKTFVKENSAVNFLKPDEYIQPFLDNLAEGDFKGEIKVKTSEEIVNANEDHTKNISYARVNVEAIALDSIKLDDNGHEYELKSIVGMVYALDIGKPLIKVYTGAEVSACTNLMIFNPDFVYQQDLTGNFKSVFDKVETYVKTHKIRFDEIIDIINKMKSNLYRPLELNETLGYLLRNVHKTKVGINPIIKASRMLDDKESIYYVGEGSNYKCSQYNLFNAITHSISNSNDILDKSTKTVSLAKIFLS